MKNVDTYVEFFINPNLPRHRCYEVLRAWFIEKLEAKKIAERFGMSYLTVQSQIRDFKAAFERGEAMNFFIDSRSGPKTDRKKPQVREHVVKLRARGYADTDIRKALKLAVMSVSVSLVDQILREEGLERLRKRTLEARERVKAELKSGDIPGLTIPMPAGYR